MCMNIHGSWDTSWLWGHTAEIPWISTGWRKSTFGAGKMGFFSMKCQDLSQKVPTIQEFLISKGFIIVFLQFFLFARDFWGKSTTLEFRRNLWILGAKDHVDHCGWSLVGYVGEYPPFLWLKYPMFVGCPPHL